MATKDLLLCLISDLLQADNAKVEVGAVLPGTCLQLALLIDGVTLL